MEMSIDTYLREEKKETRKGKEKKRLYTSLPQTPLPTFLVSTSPNININTLPPH